MRQGLKAEDQEEREVAAREREGAAVGGHRGTFKVSILVPDPGASKAFRIF